MADVTLNIRHNADQATASVKTLSNAMGSFASNSKIASKAGMAVAKGFSKIGKAAFNIVTLRGAISGLGKAISSISRKNLTDCITQFVDTKTTNDIPMRKKIITEHSR